MTREEIDKLADECVGGQLQWYVFSPTELAAFAAAIIERCAGVVEDAGGDNADYHARHVRAEVEGLK